MPRRRPTFVDTGHWLALLNATDERHARAADWHEFLTRAGARLVTTDWVLAELVAVAVVRAPRERERVIGFIDALDQAPRIELVHVTVGLRQAGWQLLRESRQRTWSWVDAVSFALMRERRLTDALATDPHFEQAGFRRLLLEEPDAHA